jgi:hypothetical protein
MEVMNILQKLDNLEQAWKRSIHVEAGVTWLTAAGVVAIGQFLGTSILATIIACVVIGVGRIAWAHYRYPWRSK